MSSQTRQPTGVESWSLSCTFCESELSEQNLAIQSYPSESASLPATLPGHGGLTLCPDCSSEVTELLSSWEEHKEPPVQEGCSIGDGYRKVTSSCSFCTDDYDGAVIGVELYRRVDDDLPAYANYTLCEDCQSILGEFLENVRQRAGQ